MLLTKEQIIAGLRALDDTARSAGQTIDIAIYGGASLALAFDMRKATRDVDAVINGFSKRLENHVNAVALHTVHYNFIRIHKTLKVSPAMASGVSKTLWSWQDVIDRMDLAAPAPTARGPYKPRKRATP